MSEEERTRKEKIEQLKEQKKQMEEELDELKGSTGKGKAICVGVFLIAIALLFGIIVALIKTDAGGFASTSLAPVIGDVPIVRSILPKELQRKTAKELLAAQSTQSDTSATQDTQNAGTLAPNANGTLGAAGNATDLNATGASGSTTNPDTTGAASNANSSGTAGTTGFAGSTQSTEEAAIQDYVQTYTSMRPRNAAQVFDSMLPDQLQLVVKILKNMKPAQRSAILAQMNVQNASDVTVEMNEELP